MPHLAPDAWLLEGYHAAFGSSLNWASRLLGCRSTLGLERLARQSPPGASGVRCLTFFAGSGTPEYNAEATGRLEGLRLGATKADVARAVIEGLCLELRRILDAGDAKARCQRVVVSGNAFRETHVLQILADVLGLPLAVSANRDLALTGAAALAWVGAERWASLDTIGTAWQQPPSRTVAPGEQQADYGVIYRDYCQRVTGSYGPGRSK
jgi:sugar (pentulose or hexulose) kinase